MLPAALTLALVAACTSTGSDAESTSASSGTGSSATGSSPSGSGAPASAAEQPPVNPAGVPGVPTNQVWVESAIRKVDGLAASMLEETNIPGMAVAVVQGGEIVFAKGYGVRETGRPDTVDPDTVFQLASVSKPIGATVIAQEVGKGTVGWDTPVVTHLPDFALADPYVTANVTVADMYSHRSGLPDHAGDLLEDLGYDRAYVLSKLKYEPLNPFRAVYNYTNFGITTGAESVARAAGVDWETLSERDIYGPLGMTDTSSTFADFQANPNHAAGHVLVDGQYQAKYLRQPDAESPAGGVSASVTDVATWLAMVLNEGKTADGTQLIDPQALNAALTPHIRAVDGSPTPATIVNRATSYGYGFNVNTDATGRVRIGHSGAFGLGAGTTFLGIPDLDLGIVVLTNAAPIGAAEALSQEFADIAESGSIQHDWRPLYAAAFAPGSAPAGTLANETPPATPVAASPNSAYVGTYQNDYVGPATVSEAGTGLVLTLGPDGQQFPLTHWDGQVFTMVPTGENAPEGSISAVTFEGAGSEGSTPASAMTVEFYNKEGLGVFRR
ncbi:serine hydrolase [Nakamurella sp.]|uniref:serine hydrolase n=1 Tax=Nakamurella sp. TaxID=1869182 RepID=UPI003784B1DD